MTCPACAPFFDAFWLLLMLCPLMCEVRVRSKLILDEADLGAGPGGTEEAEARLRLIFRE